MKVPDRRTAESGGEQGARGSIPPSPGATAAADVPRSSERPRLDLSTEPEARRRFAALGFRGKRLGSMIAEAKAGRPASLHEIGILVHLRKDGGEPTLAELRILLRGMEREGLIEHATEAGA